MKLRIIATILMIMAVWTMAYADNYLPKASEPFDGITDVDKPTHWRGEFYIGGMSHGMDFGFGIGYFPTPYFGIKAEIGLPMEWEGFAQGVVDNIFDNDYYDFYDSYYDDDFVVRFTFSPVIQLTTPALFRSDAYGMTFHLFANGGITMSPGAADSYRAKWLYWRGQAGFEARIYNWSVSLSYRLSNFYLYDGMFPDDNSGHKTGAVLLTFGYSF